jgi:uncharacterized protein
VFVDVKARQRPDQTLVVPGTGSVTVEPDIASIRLGVTVVRPTATAAREDAASVMSAVISALAAAGVDRRDLRTALVGLSPVTDYSSERGPQVTGYQLSNAVDIAVRNLPTVGAVIDAGLGAGATSLDTLHFRVADPSTAAAEARGAAVADAHRRAETLAEAAGRSLGAVVGIVEGQPPSGPFPPRPMAAMALKADAETPIEGGTQDIVVSIVVTYALD